MSLLGLKFKYEISAKHSCVSSEIFYNEHNGGEDRQVAEQRSALLRGSPSGPSGFGLGWASPVAVAEREPPVAFLRDGSDATSLV